MRTWSRCHELRDARVVLRRFDASPPRSLVVEGDRDIPSNHEHSVARTSCWLFSPAKRRRATGRAGVLVDMLVDNGRDAHGDGVCLLASSSMTVTATTTISTTPPSYDIEPLPRENRVGLRGFEPGTSALSVLRSNQLSYSPRNIHFNSPKLGSPPVRRFQHRNKVYVQSRQLRWRTR